jgi:hypothetical protein
MSYRLAETLARETGQKKLESVADVNEAGLHAKSGQLDESLQLYQSAIQVDDAIGDQSSEAEDLLAYGRFLDRAGFPARLVYACMVKSDDLRNSSLSGQRTESATPIKVSATAATAMSAAMTDPSEASLTTTQIGRRIGADAAKIRRNPQPTLQEALTLRR